MLDLLLDRLKEMFCIPESIVLMPWVTGIVWSDLFPNKVTILTDYLFLG